MKCILINKIRNAIKEMQHAMQMWSQSIGDDWIGKRYLILQAIKSYPYFCFDSYWTVDLLDTISHSSRVQLGS